jgi:hypothetical protein
MVKSPGPGYYTEAIRGCVNGGQPFSAQGGERVAFLVYNHLHVRVRLAQLPQLFSTKRQ